MLRQEAEPRASLSACPMRVEREHCANEPARFLGAEQGPVGIAGERVPALAVSAPAEVVSRAARIDAKLDRPIWNWAAGENRASHRIGSARSATKPDDPLPV